MENRKIPVIHQTDCFHNHADPDDHWDLACQFALAYEGKIDLRGILIDYPPSADVATVDCGDPAIAAVSQLNYICGKYVPVAVGCKDRGDKAKRNSGIAMLIDTLESSKEPVVIHIVGSARDVAIAAELRPELFKKNCAAIYLNAGSAMGKALEYNVKLDPYSYSRIFSLDCPIYWMPCFHTLEHYHVTEGNGTYYRFRQSEVLPYLSESLQKYFAYALGRVTENRWLSYLKYPLNTDITQAHGKMLRNMWCTAGFLHTAGYTVTAGGDIVPLGAENAVFGFVPIEASCREDGFVEWHECESSDRYIFKIKDEANYAAAMTKALKNLLSVIP